MTKVSPPPISFDEDNNAWQSWFQIIRNRIEKPLLEGDTRIAGNILKIGKNFFTANFEQFGNSAYLILDKLTEEDDASLVFRQKGEVKWEMGAVTELPGDESNFHLKMVTGPSNQETFIDVLIWDHVTGDGRVIDGFKFGIGTVPVELFHVAKTDNVGRVISKFENANTAAGSKSSAIQFASDTSSWAIGNDFALDGSSNWFLQETGDPSIFANSNGVSVGGSDVQPTEAFRVDSTIGGSLLPRMTTTQRDAFGSKTNGLTIYNTTTSNMELWNGSAWLEIAAAAPGGAVTSVAGKTGAVVLVLADITDSGALAALNTVDTAEIDNNAVTLAKMADMATASFIGRNTAATGDPEILNATIARSILNVENGATADQTNAEIKTAYEANADTNEFSDAEQTKLAGIATGATANVGDMVLGTIQTVTGAKTFDDTKFLLRNVADTFSASFVNTVTADRIFILPDSAGTIELTGHTHVLADITDSGTIASQNANAVAITGGTINGTTIGATTATTGKFTTVDATGNIKASGVFLTSNGSAIAPAYSATLDPDTGVFFTTGRVRFTTDGVERVTIRNVGLEMGLVGAAIIRNVTTTGATPSLVPNRSNNITGIGSAGTDILSLIAGGAEGIRITEVGGTADCVFDNNLVANIVEVGSFTVATLPSASATPEGIIKISDETGGETLAFSDGSSWRRVQDRAIAA